MVGAVAVAEPEAVAVAGGTAACAGGHIFLVARPVETVMDEISLGVPEPLLDALPADGSAAATDMERAVEGYNERIARVLEDADDDGEAAAGVLDVIEHFETRGQRFDDFVPELRAWGQSPVFALAWRNLYADLIAQLYEHDWLAAQLDRERTARLVEDGVRLSDR